MGEATVDLPKGYEELSDEDKQLYDKLRIYFLSSSFKNRRNKSLETFKVLIDLIKRFVNRDDVDDKKRSYVCGIAWIGDSIAVNTRNLMTLTSKCKAGVNGLFQLMGYGTVPAASGTATAFLKYFPALKDNYQELRQWTIRRRIELTPPPDQIASLVDGNKFAKPGPNTTQWGFEKTGFLGPIISSSATEPPPELDAMVPKPSFFDDEISFARAWSDDEMGFPFPGMGYDL
jgi:hypothetical protein